MTNRRIAMLLLVLGVVLSPFARASTVESFLSSLGALSLEAEAQGRAVVEGRDGWLFFAPELRSLSVGRFWGLDAQETSRAPRPEDRDPLPVMVDLFRQLESAGIDLLFVPVPGKAVVYPEKIISSGVPGERPDPYHQEFYGLLAEHGIETLDLVPVFQRARTLDPEPLYCLQDTHWSGRGCEVAARAVAEAIGPRPWRRSGAFQKERARVQIRGDLWQELPEPRPEREWVELTSVGRSLAGVLEPVPVDRGSPVLLLGDSHNLVFHAGGDLFARGAGLADHLAAELGVGIDVVAVRGSGATSSRVNLLRRGNGLDGKNILIWCLSVRELTEGSGWKKVPLTRPVGDLDSASPPPGR